MLRFSVILLLMLLGLPAAAQQGRNDYPAIVPRDWTLPPPKSNEWRAVSPRKDAWLSLYATPAEIRSLMCWRAFAPALLFIALGEAAEKLRHGQHRRVAPGDTGNGVDIAQHLA